MMKYEKRRTLRENLNKEGRIDVLTTTRLHCTLKHIIVTFNEQLSPLAYQLQSANQ